MEKEENSMTEVPAPSSAPMKATKPNPKAKKTRCHPPYCEMINKAVKCLHNRQGSSRQAIANYMKANYDLPATSATVISRNLKSMVAKNQLHLAQGTGASGRFKINTAAGAKKGKPRAAKKKKRASPKKRKSPKKKKSTKKRKSPVKKRSAKKSPKKKAAKRKTKKSTKKATKRKGKK